MNLGRDLTNISLGQWEDTLLPDDASMRLRLLESDLKSLRIAFADYLAAKHQVDTTIYAGMADSQANGVNRPFPQDAQSRMFHNAKVFVVCMRRFARILEDTKSRKHEYPKDTAQAIDLTWKKNKAFFDDYREARNAIEHINGEVNGYNRKFHNLWGDSFEVVDGKRALITHNALKKVEKAWKEIVKGIMLPIETRVRIHLMAILMNVLRARIWQLIRREALPNQPIISL